MQMREITYKEAVREAMVEEMRRDEDIIFLGEDIGFMEADSVFLLE